MVSLEILQEKWTAMERVDTAQSDYHVHCSHTPPVQRDDFHATYWFGYPKMSMNATVRILGSTSHPDEKKTMMLSGFADSSRRLSRNEPKVWCTQRGEEGSG